MYSPYSTVSFVDFIIEMEMPFVKGKKQIFYFPLDFRDMW